jgi:hypothetical protein
MPLALISDLVDNHKTGNIFSIDNPAGLPENWFRGNFFKKMKVVSKEQGRRIKCC